MAVFLTFVLLLVSVVYIQPIGFRSPARYSILIPYLMLFFGSILLMGPPMFRLNRGLWLVTAATTIFLLGTMGFAMYKRGGVNQQERLLETVFSELDAIRNAERTLPSCLKNIC
ncbi:MAG: hypothetical protein LLG42_04505 [Chloroflexi bacterium]|nr:hypothetical protein [Chloroflexota bacterium]